MAIPALMYGSEIWELTKKVQTRIQSTELNCLWKTKAVQNHTIYQMK
jgi:hypothetical protein